MRIKSVLLVSCLSVFVAISTMATENGGNAYPNGAEGFLTGIVPPPPGLYLVDYTLYYTADDFMDNSGNKIDAPFDITVWGNIPRIINVTDKKLFNAQWVQHIFIPLLYIDVTTPGGSDDNMGLGDIIIDPFILAWHTKNLHWAIGMDTYVPVGAYDKNDIANIGRNYWTFEPVAAITYLSDSGYEASIKAMYDFNTRNNATDYRSGDEFHFDYTLAKRIKNYNLGIGGYFYQQITGDDGTIMTPAGEIDAGDNKGRTIAIGPQIAYQHKGMSFILKYQQEFDTENKFEGAKFWFKFVTAL